MNDVPIVNNPAVGASAASSDHLRPVVPAVPSANGRSLAERYASEVQSILAKYPADQKRSAVMPLLYLAQREEGYVTKQAMQEIAAILDISPTEVAGVVGFYSLYYDEPAGQYRIQVCTDLPCALRGADQFLEKLCENLGIKVGETSSDGLVTVEAVMCLAGCDKAPMFQVQTSEGLEYHENQTVESALALVDSWHRGPDVPIDHRPTPASSDETAAPEAPLANAKPAAPNDGVPDVPVHPPTAIGPVVPNDDVPSQEA